MSTEVKFTKTTEIHPARAGYFYADVEYKKKKDTDKTASIKLLARTGDPIVHSYWGNIVHDLNGMKLHKSRLTIDYNHNGDEIVGYLNNFDTSTGDLVATGALTPFKEGDRASELIYKMGEGVPYEASINFADEIVIEDVEEGRQVNVNGRDLAGPMTVVRSWSLRNVAVCPMGADKNTESMLFSDSKKDQIKVTVLKQEKEMDTETVVEAEATKLEAVVAVEAETVVTETVVEEVKAETTEEVKDVEEKVEATELSESKTEVVVEATETKEEVVEEKTELKVDDSRAVFKSMIDLYGQDLAAKWFAEGLNLEQAEGQYHLAVVAENKALKSEIEKLKKLLGKDTHVSFEAESTVDSTKETAINKFIASGMTKGEAQLAASLRIHKA